MEKIITFLGNIYLLFGFMVGILSYFYSIRQYKYAKAHNIQYQTNAEKNDKTKKPKLVNVKSNLTQYIDVDEINKGISCPTLNFLNTKKEEPIILTEDRVIIGRSKTDDIIIDNPKVSRSHCVITKINEKYFLELSALKNPILINGRKLTNKKAELTDGDTISLINANILFKFSFPKASIDYDINSSVG